MKLYRKSILRMLFMVLSLMMQNQVYAQKFGYADLEYILNQSPEFKKAQAQLEALTTEWQKEVEEKLKKVDLLIKKNDAEAALMTEAIRKKRELTVKNLQKDAYNYQNKIFGPNGLLFLKRQELIVPLRKKIFYAVEKVAKKNQYQLVFDKSAGLVLIYTDPLFDLTDKILIKLGLKEEEDTKQENNN